MSLLSLLLTAAFAFATPAKADPNLSAFKDKFLEVTELEEREVTLINGQSKCLEGDIHILEIEEDGSLTVMMGARSLMTGITPSGRRVGMERKCQEETRTSFGRRSADFSRTLNCGKEKTEFQVTLTVEVTGFRYRQQNHSNGKKTFDLNCEYKYVR